MIRQILSGGRAADADSQAGGAGEPSDPTSATARSALRRPVPLAGSARRAVAARARVRLLRGLRARPPRELPGRVAPRPGGRAPAPDGAVRVRAQRRRLRRRARVRGPPHRGARALGARAAGRGATARPTHPVFVALADTIEKRDLPDPAARGSAVGVPHGHGGAPLRELQRAARLHGAVRRARRASAAGAVRLPRRPSWCASPTRSRPRCS